MKTVSQLKGGPRTGQSDSQVFQLRDKFGLSMRDVADACGVPPSSISRVENGKAPSIETAFLLAAFFETTVDELFAQYKPKTTKNAAEN